MTSCSDRLYLLERKPHWPVVNMLCESQTALDATRGKKSNIATATEPLPFNPYQTKSNPIFCVFLRFWLLRPGFYQYTSIILFTNVSPLSYSIYSLHKRFYYSTQYTISTYRASFHASSTFAQFYTWFSNLNVILYKNLLTFFSSIILMQLHNLVQLNIYLHKCPSNFVTFILLVHTNYEDETVLGNIGTYNSDDGESPNRKHTTFTTRRKFDIRTDTTSFSSCTISSLTCNLFLFKISSFHPGISVPSNGIRTSFSSSLYADHLPFPTPVLKPLSFKISNLNHITLLLSFLLWQCMQNYLTVSNLMFQ